MYKKEKVKIFGFLDLDGVGEMGILSTGYHYGRISGLIIPVEYDGTSLTMGGSPHGHRKSGHRDKDFSLGLSQQEERIMHSLFEYVQDSDVSVFETACRGKQAGYLRRLDYSDSLVERIRGGQMLYFSVLDNLCPSIIDQVPSGDEFPFGGPGNYKNGRPVR